MTENKTEWMNEEEEQLYDYCMSLSQESLATIYVVRARDTKRDKEVAENA